MNRRSRRCRLRRKGHSRLRRRLSRMSINSKPSGDSQVIAQRARLSALRPPRAVLAVATIYTILVAGV